MDAGQRLPVPQGRARRSRRAASSSGCPTGGRSARGRASASPSATPGRTSSTPASMLDFKVAAWRWATNQLDRGRMAATAGGRRRPGSSPRPMGRGRSPKAARGPRPLETRRSSRPRTACRSSKGCGCWPASRPDLTDGSRPEADEREWSFVHAGQWLGDMLAKIRGPDNLQPVAAGGLKATLRKYQETGVGWLRFLSEPGLGGLPGRRHGPGQNGPSAGPAAGAEGTGRSEKPSLLVLPASLLANWKAEMARFTPALRAAFVHPAETPKDELDRIAAHPAAALAAARPGRHQLRHAAAPGVAAGRAPGGWSCSTRRRPSRTRRARQTQTVKRLKADARIALTGTPVENRLSDLWSLFDFLCPGPARVAGPVQAVRQVAGRARGQPLRPAAEPRAAVHPAEAQDRPPRHRRPAREDRGPRVLRAEQAAGGDVRQDGPRNWPRRSKSVEGMQRRGLVLSYLMRLKQLCNHPSQLLGDGRYRPRRAASSPG